MQLVLASTSRYRRELLTRLGLPFEAVAPHTDETALVGESPSALALRLAQAKALAVAAQFPDALIIGSDQVATARTIIIYHINLQTSHYLPYKKDLCYFVYSEHSLEN